MRASLASLDTKATSCFLRYFNDVELSLKMIFNSLIRAAMEHLHMLLQLNRVSEKFHRCALKYLWHNATMRHHTLFDKATPVRALRARRCVLMLRVACGGAKSFVQNIACTT